MRWDEDDERVETLILGRINANISLSKSGNHESLSFGSSSTTLNPPEIDLVAGTVSHSSLFDRSQQDTLGISAQSDISLNVINDPATSSQGIARNFRLVSDEVAEKLSMFSGNVAATRSFFALCRHLVNLSPRTFYHRNFVESALPQL